MIKRLLAIFAATLFLASFSLPGDAHAQRNAGSLGIGLGSTTMASGLSVKQFAGPTAIQLTAGCWRSCDGLAMSLDLLFNMPALASADILTLAWNFGAGGAAGAGEDGIGIGAAFVLGLEANFRPLPIDFVLEWRPGIEVIPDPDINLIDFGAHIRFYIR